MSIQLSDAAKDAVRNVAELIDQDKWLKIYKTLYEWAHFEANHPLKAFEIGQITKFFENTCGIDILQHLTIIPRLYHIADEDITEFVVPNHITMIDDSAFRNCKKLSKLTIPTSVTAIGVESFFRCDELKRITYEGTKEQWGLVMKDYRWWTNGKPYDPKFVNCLDGDIKL